MDYCKFKFLCKLLSQFYIKIFYSPETASLTWQGNKEITVWYQGSKLACIKWILTHAQYFWKIVHCVRVSFRECWYWEQNVSHLVVQCIICHFGYYCIFRHLQDSSVAVQIYHVIAFFVLHDIMLNHDWIIVLLFLVWMTVWWISILSLNDCTFDRAAPVAHWWRWWGVRVPRAKCWGSIHVLWGLANRVLQNVR